MRSKTKSQGQQRSATSNRARVVAYFDEVEKARVQQAAKAERMSVSKFVAAAALRATEGLSLAPGRNRFQSLLELRGIGKEAFASLGGGEEFLRRERAEFNESMERREAAIMRELGAKR